MRKTLLIQLAAPVVTLSLLCFIPRVQAEKDPKASKDVAAQGSTEVDPLKAELKPGEIFNCEADIFYEWENIAKEKSEVKKNKVFFQTIVERGNDGTLAKTRLESRLLGAKKTALNECQQQHNVPECTNKKLATSQTQLQLLDFQTRRTMTANIMQECEHLAGTCVESSHSEIRCQVYRSPDSAAKKEDAPAAAAPSKK